VLFVVIAWALGAVVAIVLARGAWLNLSRRANDRRIEHNIRNRRDLRSYDD